MPLMLLVLFSALVLLFCFRFSRFRLLWSFPRWLVCTGRAPVSQGRCWHANLNCEFCASFFSSCAFYFLDVQQEYSKQIGKLDEGWAKSLSHSCQLCQGQTCALCGDKCLKLEPPVIICHHCNKRVVRGGDSSFVMYCLVSFRFVLLCFSLVWFASSLF